MSAGPLSGLRVLDLTDERAIAGAKALADLGAETIRVEPPGGDPLRWRGPLSVDGDGSYWYAYYATNRRSVTVDLSDEEGRALLRRLALDADVVLDCGALGVAGISAEELLCATPALIVVRVGSFSRTGPWRNYLAPDLVAGALGGVCATTGDADTPPLKGYGDVNFLISGSYTAVAALTALETRRATGAGQVVDLSAHEAIASCIENVFLRLWYHTLLADGFGAVMPRRGSLHSTGYFQVMQARGGSLLITPAPDAQAQIAWLAEEGAEQDLLDPRYDSRDRALFYQAMMNALRAWAKTKDVDTLFLEGQARHHAYGKVATVADIAENAHLAARNWWVAYPLITHSVRGPGPLYRFSETPWQPPGPYKQAGADTETELARLAATNGRRATSKQAMEDSIVPSALPLARLRVLDFTHVVAGPFATRILADLGADVVKVHSAVRNTGARGDQAPAYLCWNRNKRSLALNMATEEGRSICRRLATRADVLIDNFSVGVLDRWGLDYSALSRLNPGLIGISLPAAGPGGPWSSFVMYAPTIHALCGLTALTGVPGRADIGIGFSYNDHFVGLHAVIAILAALEARRRTGRGQQVEIAQLEAGVHLIAPALLEYSATGRITGPTGNQPAHGAAAPHDCYPCRGEDRWVAIAVTTDAQWRRLRALMGDPAWARDSELDTAAGRVRRMAEIDAGVAAWTRGQEDYSVQQRCQAVGVPAGAAQTGTDLATRDAELRHARFLFPLDEPHPLVGPVYGDRLPLHFSRTPVTAYRRPRLLGEDNVAVLGDWLGLYEAEVRAGEAAGIFA